VRAPPHAATARASTTTDARAKVFIEAHTNIDAQTTPFARVIPERGLPGGFGFSDLRYILSDMSPRPLPDYAVKSVETMDLNDARGFVDDVVLYFAYPHARPYHYY
jgi:hypothetical protein